jgi:long-chain fatty acid transport protein
VQVSAVVGYSKAEYSGKLGQTETERPWSLLPEFAFACPLPETDLAFGFGVNVPYGRQTRWDSSGSLRYSAPVSTEMMVMDFTPSLAWRVSDAVSIGAGLDVYYGRLQLCQLLPILSSSRVTADSDGYAVSGNAGITWRLTPNQRLALTYHAPFDLTFDGEMETTDVPSPAVSSSDFETTFKFPTIVALGYGIQITETVRLEANVEWLQYSRYKTLAIDAGDNAALLSTLGLDTVAQNWNDTWTFGVGPEWRFAREWTLRGGYKYLQSPVSDSTFSPSILDVDQSILSLGLGYQHGRHAIDLAYAVGLFSTRDISSNQNSLYEQAAYTFEGHLFALTYTCTL